MSVFPFAEALAIFHTHSALSPPIPPASHPCAALIGISKPSLPLFHPSSNTFLSPSFFPGPTHPYITSHVSSLSPSFGIHSPPPPSPVPQRPHPEILRLLNFSRPLLLTPIHVLFISILLPADAQRRRGVANRPWCRQLSVSISSACAQ
ncbi:hypothetical protein BGY98DRAFT_1004388 [Russula aff. rugulosa BPL654]|nr:hypothetical protein BGY98DRAFT_1004388 [Russula aff. rugulosa BPL654]